MAERTSATHTAHPERSAAVTRRVLRTLLPAPRPFAVRLWDGSILSPEPQGAPAFTLVLARPGALRRMLVPPTELAAGEAFIRGDWDIEGELERAMPFAAQLLRWPLRHPAVAALLVQLPADDLPDALPGRGAWEHSVTPRSRTRDRRAVHYHYNIGNDFYALFLDRSMLYTGAYFATGTEDLDQAQVAKMELICRKLRLRPGERVLELGCGWGGLMAYAAQHYGVNVVGITLSEPQAVYARNHIAAAGQAERCRVEVCDYRAVHRLGYFDKVVAVGIAEHVGRRNLSAFFDAAYRVLQPGGLFLNQAIGYVHERAAMRRLLDPLTNRWNFVWRYVFPEGDLVAPGTLLQVADAAGFETRDVENLREHYPPTLRHWVQRLEANRTEAIRVANEAIYRVWRLYMAASINFFERDYLALYQTLFAKPHADGRVELPRTRADLYAEESITAG
jgi:cyclopropane-fatty-acyl-phospholipid synthase